MTTTKDNLHFELVIGKKDGSIDNAAIPVRWCLTKELLDHIRASDYQSPQVLIQIEYKGSDYYGAECTIREERFLFPLEQFIAYVPLSKAGLISINAFIVGLTEGEQKCYNRALVSKDDYGEFRRTNLDDVDKTFVTIMSNVKEDNVNIDLISKALDFRIKIPEEIFGKKPPTWLWNLLNRYQDKDLVDQCALRRRYMFFPIKLIFIALEALVRWSGIFVVYLVLLFVGFTNVETRFLKHPLTYWWNCYGGYRMKHYIDKVLEEPEPKDTTFIDVLLAVLKIIYRVPVIYVICVGVTLLFVSFTPFTPLNIILSLIFAPTVVAILVGLFLGVCWCVYWVLKTVSNWCSNYIFNLKAVNKVVDFLFIPLEKLVNLLEKWEMEKEHKQSELNKAKLAKLEKYLTCNNDPHSVTAEVDLIPLKDRTPTLIYTNIKNKVCKPLSR